MPADYTGDGRAEIAVFLPAIGTGFVREGGGRCLGWGRGRTGSGQLHRRTLGQRSPCSGPSTGTWYVRGANAITWGGNGDIPSLAHYLGDGHTDLAVFRPATGAWRDQSRRRRRRRGRRGAGRRSHQRGVVRRHGHLRLPQPRSWLQPQLVDEETTSLRVRLEGFSLPDGGVERLP
jgi:hypothetical protein